MYDNALESPKTNQSIIQMANETTQNAIASIVFFAKFFLDLFLNLRIAEILNFRTFQIIWIEFGMEANIEQRTI